MTDYRHAGAGWPTGAVDGASILALPSNDLLMLATEARYHHAAAVAVGKRVTWRGVPRIGKRPAEQGWSLVQCVDEALNLTSEATVPITDFVGWCELDLQDERGDLENDWADLDLRYALLGGFLDSAIPLLRQRLPGARIHFPPFTPDHDALRYVRSWRSAAESADVIQIHAYDSLASIRRQYEAYRAAFPDKPLMLSEWHCKGALAEERRVLQWLAELAASDPLFFGATFFIWRWWHHPEWWDDAWDIEHSPDRLALFMNPPTVEVAPVPEYPRGIDVSNNNGHVDWDAVAASGVAFAIAKVSEGTGFSDGYFGMNWPEMQRVGLVRGAYHFGRPDLATPEDEAQYFMDQVESRGLVTGDLLALDLEDYQGSLTRSLMPVAAYTLRWLQRVEQLTGYKPLLYTSPGTIAQYGLASLPALSEYGLWCASWGVSTPPAAPAPWGLVAIHQYAVGGPGSVPGVAGECDLNRYNGDIATLPLYGKPAKTPPVEPPAPSYSVGPGILAAMVEHGDAPATDETFSTQWSEAFGVSGARYVWIVSLGRILRFEPTP